MCVVLGDLTMPITAAATMLLFCEGRPESLDASLLNHLLRGQTRKLIVPANGKQGFRAFIDGHIAAHTAGMPGRQPPRFLGFRDRDFDASPPANPALIRLPGDKPIFLSYRACIENYLLDSGLIRRYWAESSSGPAWQHGVPPSGDDIEEWIRLAAREIVQYQATRWALAAIKPGNRWPEVSTTWTGGSGRLPADLTGDYCLGRAKELVGEYGAQAGLVSEELLVKKFAEYGDLFAADVFWTASSYLTWFHGKDLQRAMGRLRPGWISLSSYFSWAVNQLDENPHLDLVDLKTKISN
jgi:hypothetical protein